jgi:hypothetical protein
VRRVTQHARQRIESSLVEQGVPVQELYLREDRSQLHRPIPLRGDLREQAFSSPKSENSLAAEASLLTHQSHETQTGGF